MTFQMSYILGGFTMQLTCHLQQHQLQVQASRTGVLADVAWNVNVQAKSNDRVPPSTPGP